MALGTYMPGKEKEYLLKKNASGNCSMSVAGIALRTRAG
jgi:hypothetical protein